MKFDDVAQTFNITKQFKVLVQFFHVHVSLNDHVQLNL